MNLPVNRNGSVEPKTGLTPRVGFLGVPTRRDVFEKQGLFTRQRIDETFLTTFEQTVTQRLGTVSLEDWQLWGQHAWKAEHGTETAATRFGNKLIEETHELDDAIGAYLTRPSPTTRRAVVREAGDAVWSLFATASNAGASIEYSLQEWLIKAAKGTLVQSDEGWVEPEWKPKAVAIGTSSRVPVTVTDIDELFTHGYVPQPSPVMNIDPISTDPEAQQEMLHQWSVDRFLAEIIAGTHQAQYSEDASIPFDVYRDNIGEVSSQLFMSILYTVRSLTRATAAEILIINYSKVSGRTAANLIDRSDGARPPALQ